MRTKDPGETIEENKVIQGGSIAEVALIQEAAALGSLCDLRQSRPPLWASNSVSFRLM